jgi:hypothetical protein
MRNKNIETMKKKVRVQRNKASVKEQIEYNTKYARNKKYRYHGTKYECQGNKASRRNKSNINAEQSLRI